MSDFKQKNDKNKKDENEEEESEDSKNKNKSDSKKKISPKNIAPPPKHDIIVDDKEHNVHSNAVETLKAMGFDLYSIEHALEISNDNIEMAVQWMSSGN